jgi:outer membrane lipoprotein-sorting protein
LTVSFLRRLPTSRLIVVCVMAVALIGGGAAVAVAALSTSAGAPPPKPLPQAVHDALAAPKLPGVTARIRFTNKLIDDSSVEGGSALLKGATGRLWATEGHLRLELQSGSGDVQILADDQRFSLYDASSNTVYRGTIPKEKGSARKDTKKQAHQIPTVAKIQEWINHAMRDASVSGAIPSTVAGQPTYTVRVGPKHDGGLLGAGEVAWDAVRGVPLRAAVYAQGSDTPVLELTATEINYGAVPAGDFAVAPPSNAKVVQVSQPSGNAARSRAHAAKRAHESKHVRGLAAVQAAVPFKLSAPDKLVGLPRREVKLLEWGGKPAALVAYGQNLGGVAVIERSPDPAKPAKTGTKRRSGERRGNVKLPTLSVNGASGTELATALGTVVTFDRGGVSYTVVGSVPPAAAEAAARGL